MTVWDFTRVAEEDGKQMMKALEEGFEPFAALLLPVQSRESALDLQPKISMIPFIYFKRASETKESVVEESKSTERSALTLL